MAATALDSWYGKTWRERPHYGTVLHAGATQGVKALPALLELAQDAKSPAVVRATAATLGRADDASGAHQRCSAVVPGY